MEKKEASVFDLGVQASSLDAKIIIALERVAEVASFANDLQPAFEIWSEDRKSQFFAKILELITKLKKLGFINVQRTCQGCRYFQDNKGGYYCKLLKMPLQVKDFRIDCPEFEEA